VRNRLRKIAQSAGAIPVLYEVDVVVVWRRIGRRGAADGGCESGRQGVLAAPRPYLGEDMCATYRLWLDPGEEPSTDLAREIFKPGAPRRHELGRGCPSSILPASLPLPSIRDTKSESLLS